MTVTIDTPAATAATEANATLDRLKLRQVEYEEAALAGTLSPSAVTEIEGELRFAQMRADAANRAAAAEHAALGDNSAIGSLLEDFLADSALSTAPITRAYERITEALAEFDKANTERNGRIAEWGTKLRAAGVPDNGLTVDGRPVRLSTNGSLNKSVGRIEVGNAAAQTAADPAPYMRGAAAKWVKAEGLAVQADSIDRLDTRTNASTAPLTVRIVQAVGGRAVGSVVNSYTTPRSALARLVRGGYAEVVGGDLPDPTLTEALDASRADADQARRAEAAAYGVH